VKKFLIHRWFLISLAVVLLVGMAFHSALEPLSEIRAFRNGVVATVLFLMALPLEARAVWQSLRRPLAPLLGVTVNLLLLPIFAWFVSLGLSPTWAVGLYVAAATPCTLASAAVWTRRAGGNESVAILVTIITNLSCFVVTPLWLWILTGHRLETASAELAMRGLTI
jgi:solute carrier family 10 (sodium/bile acid cotransporter), member 7